MKGYIIKNGKVLLTNSPEPSLIKNHLIIKNLCLGVNHFDVISLNDERFHGERIALGFEGVGVIEHISKACDKKFEVGQKVCYATAFHSGAFAEKVSLHEKYVMPLPREIPDDFGATLFKGLAAHTMLFSAYILKKSDTIGLTAPSGGTGSYMAQWASHYGVKVIGLTSSQKHKSIALENGCIECYTYEETEKFLNEAKKLSKTGLGLNAFYDGIGTKAYPTGIKSLAPFGLYLQYGQLDSELKGMSAKHFQKKALFFTTPSTFYSKSNIADLTLTTSMVFEGMRDGKLRPNITRYKFSHLQKALDDIKRGEISGQKILVVE